MAEEMSAFQKLISFLIQLEEKRAKLWKEELKKMPAGGFTMETAGDMTYIDHVIKGNHNPITHDLDLVYKLARKRYLKLKLREHETQYGFIYNRHRIDPRPNRYTARIREFLIKCKNANLDMMRITLSPEQYQWVHEDYPHDVIEPGERYYETYSGVRMRSKSERDIGNELEIAGIPYRYGQKVTMEVDWMEGVQGNVRDGWKVYYPDFLILTATGDKIVWEHLGRLDLSSYRSRNAEKFAAGRQGGYVSEEMLILTVEHDLEDGNFIRGVIARRILPYM